MYTIKISTLPINSQFVGNIPIFYETEMVWKTLGKTYTGSFRELIIGELPEEKEVLASLLKIASRLNEIKWDFKIPNS